MAKINLNTNTTEFKLAHVPDVEEKFSRGYLGMSGLGSECLRSVWYGFRFASKKVFPQRVKRIFERGDWTEHRVIRDLKAIGIEVFRRNKLSEAIEIFGHKGEEQECIIGFAGHAKGHTDGRCIGVIEAPKTEHLLEIKSMNDAQWKKFKKIGVKDSHPVYYAQVQRYMEGTNLTRTLFISENKNDERRGVERIRYDKDFAQDLKNREREIIISDQPLGERYNRTWYACKTCNHFSVCQDEESPVVTCRSCEHVDLATGGKWLCALNNDKELSIDDQIAACKSYKRLF